MTETTGPAGCMQRRLDWAWITAHGSGAKHELALWQAGGTNAHTWLSLEVGLMAWLQNKLFYSRPQSILFQIFLVVEKLYSSHGA